MKRLALLTAVVTAACSSADTTGPHVRHDRLRQLPPRAVAAHPARPVDVHMFGYQGTTPSIQPRTLRETAASLALVNGLLAAR